MRASRKLVIIGDSAFAEVAHEYFSTDSDYEVASFAVEREYLTRDNLAGLPVVALEELEMSFPPGENDIFVAVAYGQLNRLRSRLLGLAQSKGYLPASYVSSRATISSSVRIGRHCFIFEENVIQPFVEIGDNVVMWSGNHIGHHSRIADNCFISSHVVVSGLCEIAANCFIGVNATLADNVNLARDTWIGPGVVMQSNSEEGAVYRLPKTSPVKADSRRLFKVER